MQRGHVAEENVNTRPALATLCLLDKHTTTHKPTHLLGCSDGLLANVCANRTEHWPPVCLLLHETGSNPRAITCVPFDPPVGRHSVLLVFVYVHGGHYCSTCRHYAACRLRGKSRWADEGTLNTPHGKNLWTVCCWRSWDEQLTSCRRHRLKQPIPAALARDVTAPRIPDGPQSCHTCRYFNSFTTIIYLIYFYF